MFTQLVFFRAPNISTYIHICRSRTQRILTEKNRETVLVISSCCSLKPWATVTTEKILSRTEKNTLDSYLRGYVVC